MPEPIIPVWVDLDSRHTGHQAAQKFADEYWDKPRKIVRWNIAAFKIKDGGWYRITMHDGHWSVVKSEAPRPEEVP